MLHSHETRETVASLTKGIPFISKACFPKISVNFSLSVGWCPIKNLGPAIFVRPFPAKISFSLMFLHLDKQPQLVCFILVETSRSQILILENLKPLNQAFLLSCRITSTKVFPSNNPFYCFNCIICSDDLFFVTVKCPCPFVILLLHQLLIFPEYLLQVLSFPCL